MSSPYRLYIMHSKFHQNRSRGSRVKSRPVHWKMLIFEAKIVYFRMKICIIIVLMMVAYVLMIRSGHSFRYPFRPLFSSIGNLVPPTGCPNKSLFQKMRRLRDYHWKCCFEYWILLFSAKTVLKRGSSTRICTRLDSKPFPAISRSYG